MTVTGAGYLLAGLTAVAIIAIGVRFIVAPRVAASGYGVPQDPDRPSAGAYLRVKGVRDIVSGLVVAVLIVAGATQLLGWVILVATIIPIADAAIVLGNGGAKSIALGVHGGTAALMILTAALLLVS